MTGRPQLDPDYLCDLFEPLGAISVRRMFGGQGIYHEGLMFALIADGEIYLKADKETEGLFAKAGSEPFTYVGRTKPVRMSYWRMPEEALDDAEELKLWAERGYAAAVRSKRLKRPRKRSDHA